MEPGNRALELIILIPVYNDWESARLMIPKLDSNVAEQPIRARIIFLDDCSTTPAPADLLQKQPSHLLSVESLRLRRNLGHQRAIAIGLSFAFAERKCDAMLVMDADGQDKPEDVPRLVAKFIETGGKHVIFAERIRRSENFFFQLCYHLFRWTHRLLTGIPVRVGNFSMISIAHVPALLVAAETWNHYAASIVKNRIPHQLLPAARGLRLEGRSRMDFVALVLHGLSAISVFAETVSVRLTLAMIATMGLLVVLLAASAIVRWGMGVDFPAWTATVAGLLAVAAFQVFALALGLTLLVLFSRNNFSFLPLRDYRFFVDAVHTSYERSG